MIVHVRAPATSANLGPGFDCAGIALELWNELEVSEGEGVEIEGEGTSEAPRDASHLGLLAFALVSDIEGKRFRFLNRIPFERGLGSSSATIVLGLVAACLWEGREPHPAELLPLAMQLEPHADNLASCLLGGVTLAWRENGAWSARRIADSLPFEPLAVVPRHRVETLSARAGLPAEIPHGDAAFSAATATLLGAGLSSGDPQLLAAAFHDRVHEPYRAAGAPALQEIRQVPPVGSVGVTLSGSGPTVIVWTRPAEAERCLDELSDRFTDACVMRLPVATSGAGSL